MTQIMKKLQDMVGYALAVVIVLAYMVAIFFNGIYTAWLRWRQNVD